jgi:hypothetical protein
MEVMTWLGTDLNLLETDIEQLHRHLDWLLEDLRTHQAGRNGDMEAMNALVGEVAECLERFRRFDILLDKIRQTVN